MIDLKAELDVRLGETLDRIERHLARQEREQPRVIRLPVGLSTTQSFVTIGDGPSVGRQWQVRRVQIDGPILNSGAPIINSGSVTDPSAGASIVNIPAAQTVPGFYDIQVTAGYGSTPGTHASNFRLSANGVGIGSFGPALAANTSQVFTFNNVYDGPGHIISVTAAVADTAGIYNATIVATPIGAGPVLLYSDVSLSQASLLWEFSTSPACETWGRDEMTLYHPDQLVVASPTTGTVLVGSVQIVDMPVGEYAR